MILSINKHWQSHYALAQIIPDRLSQAGRVAGEVQHIVNDLERHPNPMTEPPGGGEGCLACLA